MTIVPKAPAPGEVGRLVLFRHHGSCSMPEVLLPSSRLRSSFYDIDFGRWGPVIFAPPAYGIPDPVLP